MFAQLGFHDFLCGEFAVFALSTNFCTTFSAKRKLQKMNGLPGNSSQAGSYLMDMHVHFL
jgi:hypothetical protein